MKIPSTNTHPPAIIFDFGGMLLDWNPRYLYHKLFLNDEQGMERFLAEIGFDEWNHLQDAGRPFSGAIAELCLLMAGATSKVHSVATSQVPG
jgi:2-haloacid dehalogenase